jgi:hypothetical protein
MQTQQLLVRPHLIKRHNVELDRRAGSLYLLQRLVEVFLLEGIRVWGSRFQYDGIHEGVGLQPKLLEGREGLTFPGPTSEPCTGEHKCKGGSGTSMRCTRDCADFTSPCARKDRTKMENVSLFGRHVSRTDCMCANTSIASRNLPKQDQGTSGNCTSCSMSSIYRSDHQTARRLLLQRQLPRTTYRCLDTSATSSRFR